MALPEHVILPGSHVVYFRDAAHCCRWLDVCCARDCLVSDGLKCLFYCSRLYMGEGLWIREAHHAHWSESDGLALKFFCMWDLRSHSAIFNDDPIQLLRKRGCQCLIWMHISCFLKFVLSVLHLQTYVQIPDTNKGPFVCLFLVLPYCLTGRSLLKHANYHLH